jgi:hypothetical protein
MNSSFKNISLFIKRAETHQTADFITDMFKKNNIGIVKEVQFITKRNNCGDNYNGVIVRFERWYNNETTEKLINDLSSAVNGALKFNFNKYQYWFISVHKEEIPVELEEKLIVDASLTDKEKISKLEEIIKSMSTQIYYMEKRLEKAETSMMECERKNVQHHIINTELLFEIEEKEMEKKWMKDKFEEEILNLKNATDIRYM